MSWGQIAEKFVIQAQGERNFPWQSAHMQKHHECSIVYSPRCKTFFLFSAGIKVTFSHSASDNATLLLKTHYWLHAGEQRAITRRKQIPPRLEQKGFSVRSARRVLLTHIDAGGISRIFVLGAENCSHTGDLCCSLAAQCGGNGSVIVRRRYCTCSRLNRRITTLLQQQHHTGQMVNCNYTSPL